MNEEQLGVLLICAGFAIAFIISIEVSKWLRERI